MVNKEISINIYEIIKSIIKGSFAERYKISDIIFGLFTIFN